MKARDAGTAAAALTGVCADCGGPCREEYERCWSCFRQDAGTWADCGGVCGPGRELCRRCYMQRNDLSECPCYNRVKPQRFALCYSCQFGPRPGEPGRIRKEIRRGRSRNWTWSRRGSVPGLPAAERAGLGASVGRLPGDVYF